MAENPLFYFGVFSMILIGLISAACGTYASSIAFADNNTVYLDSFLNKEKSNADDLFFSSEDKISLETPDLKIAQDNTLFGVAPTSVVSAKVLGDAFGSAPNNGKAISTYVVQPGDTFQSIADFHNISVNTLLWANDLTSSSKIKVGDELNVLPTNGVLHLVKSGDTVSAIAEKYKTKADDVIAYNDLASQDDIYIGDILIVPGGTMPKKYTPMFNNLNQVPLADNYFIFPVQGKVTQGIHYYNAVDVANKCGTPVYAAAAGVVQRVKYGYNFGGGNLLTILHSNGTVTYYGHLMTIMVKAGDRVDVGQNIALVGGKTGTPGDGLSTGCHLHFQVVGAKNPLAKFPIGSNISYK